MSADQMRSSDGRFGTRTPGVGRPNSSDRERMVDIVKFRVPTHVSRHLGILFHQHRQEFGWQVPSDMYRELMSFSLSKYNDKVKNPSPEMQATKLRNEELERMKTWASRHADFEVEIDQVDKYVDATFRAGDLEAVGSMLEDFVSITKKTKDSAIKLRREMEYDRRWRRIHEGLHRHASLNPRDFENDD